MRALIVVPTYNEAENINELVEAILASTSSSIDILIVDDNSPDGTGALADILAVRHEPRVRVLHREKKLGLGTAYVNGFRWGLARPEYDAFVEMDADFSHNPSYLKTMFEMLEVCDVAIGSRNIPGGGTVNWGIGRKILSRGGSFYSRIILGAPIRDFTGGFNGWRRPVLDAVDLGSLRSDGYSFQIELKYRAFLRGYRIKEFPIIFEDRKVGQSKMNRRIVFEALARVWGFRFNSRKFLTAPERAH